MKEGHDEKCEDERFDMVCCCSCRAAENALAKRVEELETLLWKLHDEEMHSVSAHIYSAARNAVWHEAVEIAERRAGRACGNCGAPAMSGLCPTCQENHP